MKLWWRILFCLVLFVHINVTIEVHCTANICTSYICILQCHLLAWNLQNNRHTKIKVLGKFILSKVQGSSIYIYMTTNSHVWSRSCCHVCLVRWYGWERGVKTLWCHQCYCSSSCRKSTDWTWWENLYHELLHLFDVN